MAYVDAETGLGYGSLAGRDSPVSAWRGERGKEAHNGYNSGQICSLRNRGCGLGIRREALRIEAQAIERVHDRLDGTIIRAAELIHRSLGSVIVTGMGKAGLVGQKLAATFTSTGTRAFPLHPAEAVHGDLGRIRAGDIVIAAFPKWRNRGSSAPDSRTTTLGSHVDRNYRTQ